MKKITFFLCALLISAMSFAQTTVTKTTSQLVTEHGWTVSAGNTIGTLATEFALDEVVTISTTGKPNCGSIWGTAPNNDYRLYQASSGNIVVTVKSGYELKSIKFTYGTSKSGTLKDGSTNIPSKTALDVTGTTKTLTVGNTSTNTNGQVRITEFSVTYVATAPADAKKYTVTATVNDEKMGKVTGTGEYVENSTATIKAVANPGYEFVKWEDSSTANPRTITVTANTEVAATFQAMTPITCAEVNNLADGDALLLGEFTVVYVNDRYTYIQDATGSALLYASGLGLEAGNVVTGLAGTLSIYNGLPEIIPANKKADWTITNGTVPEPTVFAAAPAKTDVNKYVKFEGVTLSANATFTTESATNATMVVNGTNVTLRNTFKLAATLSKDKTYDIVGFVAIYNSNIQVYFLSAEELVVNHTITVSANPAEAGTVTGGGEFEETDEITVKAVANEGYEFVCWTEGADTVSTEAEYGFVVLANRNLVANFKEAEPEIEWVPMELEITNLVTEVMEVEGAKFLQLMGRDDMNDADVTLFLNNYADVDDDYVVNAESSYMTFGGMELTILEGTMTQTSETAKGTIYEGTVRTYAAEEEMYVEFALTMYAAPVTVLVLTDAIVAINEKLGTLTFDVATGEDEGYYVELAAYTAPGVHEGPQICLFETPEVVSYTNYAETSVADGIITLKGEFTSPVGPKFDLTISGTLPVVEPEVIAYELNGGVLPAPAVPTNEELWIAFMPYYQEYYDVVRAEQPIASVAVFLSAGMGDDATIFTSEDSDYKWLGDYIIKVTTEQSAALTTLANWKFNAQAFFNANQYTGWPKSADFTEAGKPENWGPAYQAAHGVVLPTEPVEEDYTLPTPVKEGCTFVGWYDNAEGKGDPYTVIPAGWSGTLYAIWEVQGPTTALDNIAIEGKVVKTIINGQLIIVKNGVQYNAQGQVIK